MDNRCIASLEPNAPLWVWDGAWFPAHLVESPLDPSTSRILVRFGHGVSAPIAVSHVMLRDPALNGSDRPSGPLSAMMYAESLRTTLDPPPVQTPVVKADPITSAPRGPVALHRRQQPPKEPVQRPPNPRSALSS